MMSPHASTLILHGAVISLLASLGGFIYGRKLVTPSASERERLAWRLVHSAGSLAGIGLVALGASVPVLSATPRQFTVMFWSALGMGYLFMLGMVAAAVGGGRGLQPGGSWSNHMAYGAYVAASVATLVLWVVVALAALG